MELINRNVPIVNTQKRERERASKGWFPPGRIRRIFERTAFHLSFLPAPASRKKAARHRRYIMEDLISVGLMNGNGAGVGIWRACIAVEFARFQHPGGPEINNLLLVSS